MRGARAYRNLGDGQLGALVAERDTGALDELFVRYGELTYALATRIVRDADKAASLVEDAFVTLWSEAGRLDAATGGLGQGAGARLLGLVHAGAVEAIRRDERLRRARGPDTGFEVRLSTAATDRARRIRRALQRLPERDRRALALAYLGGYTQHEVAVLTGAPLEAVTSGMAASLRRLKDTMLDPREQPSEWTTR